MSAYLGNLRKVVSHIHVYYIYIMVKPNFKGINRDINVIYALGHYISL